MKYSDTFLQSVNDHTAKIRALRKKLNELDTATKITVFNEHGNQVHSVRDKELKLYIETLKDNINKLEEQLQATLENNK